MGEETPSPVPRLTLDRLCALTDGILAVVITILVLGIDVPEDHSFSEQGLLAFFGADPVSSFSICGQFLVDCFILDTTPCHFSLSSLLQSAVVLAEYPISLSVDPCPFLCKGKVCLRGRGEDRPCLWYRIHRVWFGPFGIVAICDLKTRTFTACND